MTDIKDLELRIKSAESTLEMLRGDLHALKEQQEKDKQPERESLFGRWATHPKYGRGIITDDRADVDGGVPIVLVNKPGRPQEDYVPIVDLDLDPATLNTAKDFEDAPQGTIVEATEYPHDVAVKIEDGWYRAGGRHSIAVEYMPTCRVIRWGNSK